MVSPPRQTDLTGPGIALAFPSLAEEDLEAAAFVPKEDHHGGSGFRLQFSLRELERQEELAEAFDSGFVHEQTYRIPPLYLRLALCVSRVRTMGAWNAILISPPENGGRD